MRIFFTEQSFQAAINQEVKARALDQAIARIHNFTFNHDLIKAAAVIYHGVQHNPSLISKSSITRMGTALRAFLGAIRDTR